MLIKKQTGRDHTERRAEHPSAARTHPRDPESPGWLRRDLLHGLEQSLSVVLEGHDQLQLGASGLHGWGGRVETLEHQHGTVGFAREPVGKNQFWCRFISSAHSQRIDLSPSPWGEGAEPQRPSRRQLRNCGRPRAWGHQRHRQAV